MKILFSTCRNPDFETISEYIETALKRLGHEVVWFDDRGYTTPAKLRGNIPFFENLDRRLINHRLVSAARSWRPDLVLEAGGERIFPETIDNLRALGITTALWTIDTLHKADTRPALATAFDHVFCGGTEMIEALRDIPLRHPPVWLPFACDLQKHHPVELSAQDEALYACDIAFVGSLHPALYPQRLLMLEGVADLGLALWGPGAEDLPAASPLKKCVRGGKTPPFEWLKIYSAAKINLCAHYVDPEGKLPCYQASPRIYEVMACGGFVLSDKRSDLEALFIEDREIVFAATPQKMREKALFYLAHTGERKAIAKAGQKKVLAGHSYTDRMKTLLEEVNR